MNHTIRNTSTVSFPLGTVLTILFIILKLTHVISWSWLWVFSPLWIPFVFVLALMGVIFAFVGLVAGLAFLFTCFKN